MGPVSLCLAAGSALVVVLTRRAKDPSLPILAWCLALSLALSFGAHLIHEPLSRATPLMLIDVAGLYATGMMAICRFDAPQWLYVICAAFTAQCLAHLAYVTGFITNNQHILILNALFITELVALLVGNARQPRPEPSLWRRGQGAFS